jgi:hypothetical protein
LKQKYGTGIKTKNYGTSIKTKIRYRYHNMVTVLRARIRILGSARHHKKLITVLRARIRILGSARHHKKIDNGSARPDPHPRIRAAS